MKLPETELCSYSVEAVERAVEAGLTRVELCARPDLEGTTPDFETIVAARKIIDEGAKNGGRKVELSVMIRPRGGDFVYSDEEFAAMRSQIETARRGGADGVVFGILTPSGDVDVERTDQLVKQARGDGSAGENGPVRPMEATFHRAFDVARDWREALEYVIVTGCARLLSSGQAGDAFAGREVLAAMVEQAAGRIEIMAGAGVGPENARALMDVGVDALHFSARVTAPDGRTRYADEEFIRKMVEII